MTEPPSAPAEAADGRRWDLADVTATRGLRIEDDDDDDPVLLGADGNAGRHLAGELPVRRADDRAPSTSSDKRLLQIELLKLQNWIKDTGERLVILFEGRDAAGKGGTIKRFMEHLNPRGARVVALEKPSERERTQWYFQRYVAHLPAAGEIVLFDRSWYNRAGVERVMGFCTRRSTWSSCGRRPELERMLVRVGHPPGQVLVLGVAAPSSAPGSRSARSTRCGSGSCRPMDLASLDRWDDYTEAKEAMFFYTDTADAPWTVIKSNDKKRARLEAMRHVLSLFPYTEKDHEVVSAPDPLIVGSAALLVEHGQRILPRLSGA